MGWVRRWDGGGDDDDDDASGYVGMIDGVLDGVSLGVLPGWVLFFPGPVDFDLDLLPLLALPVLVLLLPLHPPLLLLLLPLHHHHHIHHIHLHPPPHRHPLPPPLAHLSRPQNNSTRLRWRAPWMRWRVWGVIDEDGRGRETSVWSARCGDGHRLICDDDSRCVFENETYAPSGGSPTPPCWNDAP